MVKQVIVVRTDLNMRKGKIGAQVAHASMKVLLDRMSTERKFVPVFLIDEKTNKIGPTYQKEVVIKSMMFDPESAWDEWVNGLFTKIVLGVGSLEELYELRNKAAFLDLPFAIIEDAGKTEFFDECPRCSGTGFVPITNDTEIEMECSLCNGEGKVSRPTITCMAIGPAESAIIDQVTGQLKPI